MASAENTAIEAFAVFVDAKRDQYKAEIETLERALQMWREHAAEHQSTPSTASIERLRNVTERPVREIVLEAIGSQSTFKLKALIDRLIVTGNMSGPRTAIYGTVTGMLRRNDHIFKKMRRGQYRVLRPVVEADEKSATEHHQEMSAQPVGLGAMLKERSENPPPVAPVEQRLRMALAKSA